MSSTASTSSIRDFFAEHGYYHARGVFGGRQLARLQEDFDRIALQLQQSGEQINARWKGAATDAVDGGDTVVLHTHNVQHYSSAWAGALFAPALLDVAEAILGPDIVLHHTKLFQKPPEKGAPFPMHQDWTYFPTREDSMIAGIIHLSEATDEMGCLRIFPGSHRLGRVEGSGGQDECRALEQYPIEEATPVEAAAGDVVFFHYFTLHGSLPNRSAHTRKTVLTQFYSGSDVPEPGKHTDEKWVLRGFNATMTRSRAVQPT